MQEVDQEYRWKTLGPASALPSFTQAVQLATEVEESAEKAPAEASEHEAGYEAGYAEGEAAGRAAAQAANQSLLASLQEVATELSRIRGEVFERSFADMADALKILFQRLFLHELSTDPALLEALCDELKRVLQTTTAPELRLSPVDYAQITSVADGLGLLIREDAHLPAGVMRAMVGKSVAELDVNANLEAVFAQVVHEMDESGTAQEADEAHRATQAQPAETAEYSAESQPVEQSTVDVADKDET